MGNKYKNSPKKGAPVIKRKHAMLLGWLFAIIMMGLMALLYILCIRGRPLWLITTVLLVNIICLVLLVIFDIPRDGKLGVWRDKKYRANRVKLLRWVTYIALFFLIYETLAYRLKWSDFLVLLPIYILRCFNGWFQKHREDEIW